MPSVFVYRYPEIDKPLFKTFSSPYALDIFKGITAMLEESGYTVHTDVSQNTEVNSFYDDKQLRYIARYYRGDCI